jgi:hypothetical protein
VNPQLRHGFADWGDVSWIARGKALDPDENSRSRLGIVRGRAGSGASCWGSHQREKATKSVV